MVKMIQINVGNVPSELLEQFDHRIRGKYANRSEAIRDLMRDFVEAFNVPGRRVG